MEEGVGRPNGDPLSTGPCSSGRWGPRPAVALCGYAALRDTWALQAMPFPAAALGPLLSVKVSHAETMRSGGGKAGLGNQP